MSYKYIITRICNSWRLHVNQWQQNAAVKHWFAHPCIHHGNKFLPILRTNIWVCIVSGSCMSPCIVCLYCTSVWKYVRLCLLSFWTVLTSFHESLLCTRSKKSRLREEPLHRNPNKHLLYQRVKSTVFHNKMNSHSGAMGTMARWRKRKKKKNRDRGSTKRLEIVHVKAWRGEKQRRDTECKYCLEVERQRGGREGRSN